MFNSNSDTLDQGITLLRRLHLLVDLRKRHAFDFLASLPDLDMYAPRPHLNDFNDDIEMRMSNDWEEQELEEIARRGLDSNKMGDNLFVVQNTEEEYETIREDSDNGQGLSFGESLKASEKGASRNSFERVNVFNNGDQGMFYG
jgi:hypothetical protein